MSSPPCSSWNVWVGSEIEGTTELGKKTLFIRHGSWREHITEDIKRIWFCANFDNWLDIQDALGQGFQVCLEVTPESFSRIPRKIFMRVRVYFKLNVPLKDGDMICVGKPYRDQAFRIGDGKKVKPEDYNNDIRLI